MLNWLKNERADRERREEAVRVAAMWNVLNPKANNREKDSHARALDAVGYWADESDRGARYA
jgi:hypothetical protein